MTEDEVVREVRAAREAFAAAHGYDIRAMVAALREVEIAGGREIVRFAPQPPAVAGKAAGPDPARPQNGPASSRPGTSQPTEAGAKS
jgi:hypothetical protein